MSKFNKYRLKGAYHYDWYETEDWYKWAVDRCVNFCKGSTLDVGCGDGLLLSKLPDESWGIDADADAIALCQQRGLNVALENVDDFNVTPYDDFEYLSCLNVIEHLEHPEVLLDIIRNNISKGAIIITIDWQGGAFGEDHKKEYTLDELVEFFKEFNPKPFRYKDTEWIGVEITK